MTTQQLIDENLDLVVYRAQAAAKRYHDEYGEFMTSGYIGLMRAAERFDPDKDVRFRQYAQYRIDGAIRDQVRSETTGRTNDTKSGGSPRWHMWNRTRSLDSMLGDKDDWAHKSDFLCTETVDEIEQRDAFRNLLRGLSRQEQLILTLYYVEGMNFREIGRVMRLSESRICQIHKQLLNRYRAILPAQG